MKITVLGCGSSSGVPMIGNNWGECDPNNPYNIRTRVSVLVEENGETILIDASPDCRQQLLACNLKTLSAVLFTHAHADHCHGIDDLRGVNWLIQKPLDLYANPTTMNELEQRFSYVFKMGHPEHFFKPVVNKKYIEGPFSVGPVVVTPFIQNHGNTETLGFRFGDFAYSTDVHTLNEEAFEVLSGIKVWVVDCVRDTPHPTHSHLEQTLQWIARVKPERAYLTHLNHTMDYDRLLARLPRGVWPAHDGLVLEC